MRSPTPNRRSVLRGAAGVAVALPALQLFAPRSARAAQVPRRFVVFYSPNGTNNPDQFTPTGTGPAFKLGKELAPLEPFREHLLPLSGIDMRSAFADGGDLHAVGMAHMLTARRAVRVEGYAKPGGGAFYVSFAGGISIDQEIARHVGKATRFPSLEFGVQTTKNLGSHPFTRMIYRGAKDPVPPMDDPKAMFARLFSQVGGDNQTALNLTAITAQRKSVLDFVKEDHKRLSARLGGEDRRRVDQHLTTIREVEGRLFSSEGTRVVGCQRPDVGTLAEDHNASEAFPRVGKQQMDLLRLALTCDLTRVASLQWSWARSTLSLPWSGASGNHHDMSHSNGASEKARLATINAWYAEQLAYLVRSMAETQEATGSLLDNTVILYTSECALGPNHSFRNVRAVLVGRCGGHFNTGRHVRFGGEPHNRLMVSLLQAMGVESNQFGDPTLATGPLPGLTG